MIAVGIGLFGFGVILGMAVICLMIGEKEEGC